jgi:glutamate synthase (NADPH/NADH) small chain
MEKHLIDRRMAQMEAEGVQFRVNTCVGQNVSAKQLVDEYDAVVLTGGSEEPRDLPIPGRDLKGVYFAMEFLTQQTRRVLGDDIPEGETISATGKQVVVIGGGDTGSDCIGTSARHGATEIMQLEILPKPPEKENKSATWPHWPNKLRTSSSHQEGCLRDWSVTTKEFRGENGCLQQILCARVEWTNQNGRWVMNEIPGSEFTLKADLAFLAMGFVHPVHEGMLNELGAELDERGNVKADTNNYRTSVDKVFAAGDMRRGQSLVVWAIREGRQAARAVDEYLAGASELPR